MRGDRKRRKALSAKQRIRAKPLFIVAGVVQHLASEVEARVRSTLGRASSIPGEVIVPQLAVKQWYSSQEALELFRRAAQTVISEVESQSEQPTPSAVFLLFVEPPREDLLTPLRDWFEFWAWPEKLTHRTAQAGIPPSAERHWSRNPVAASEAVVDAIHRIQATESRWQRVAAQLRDQFKSPLRLPPINFRFPAEDRHLREAFRRIMSGEDGVQLPRLQRAPQGEHRIPVGEHFRDSCGRFFPLGKAEHGALRELEQEHRREERIRLVWLNAAYRFGCWIGDQQEHFDVQRARGNVSPPEVFCAKRDRWARADRGYVNMFLNDSIRDNDIFKS